MHQVLVAARRSFTVAFGIFSCGMWTLSCIMWGLVPWPRTEPGPLALGAWSLSHWTTREVPEPRLLFYCGESKHLSLSLLESCCVDISFHFSQCLSRSGMTGSYGTFWRNYQIVFPCSCAISRSQQECMNEHSSHASSLSAFSTILFFFLKPCSNEE